MSDINLVAPIGPEEYFKRLSQLNPKRKYAAMYSSGVGAYVTDPALMVIPIDDHMVHRGDGVFEAVRLTERGFFLMKEHLARLARSADWIGLKLPHSIAEIDQIARNLQKISGLKNAVLRIFVSRGPGDFSPSPYSTLGSQLYVALMESPAVPPEKFAKGASAMFSSVPVKPGLFAQVKSCNYLPNVMTKKESVDRGYDFALNLNEHGVVAEGPTENVLVLTADGDLFAPKFDYTLRGTTLVRVLEIAQAMLTRDGVIGGEIIRTVGSADLKPADFLKAREVMMVGTTQEVLPVTRIENQTVGDGAPGPVARALRAELLKEL